MGDDDIIIRPTSDRKFAPEDEAIEVSVEQGTITILGNITGTRGQVAIGSSIAELTLDADLTLAEIEERTGVPRSTLRRHARVGTLAARLVGGRWVTSEQDFIRYMSDRVRR
jgi:hypothetical protein